MVGFSFGFTPYGLWDRLWPPSYKALADQAKILSFISSGTPAPQTSCGGQCRNSSYRHSTYPGGITETNFQKMQQRFPGRALQKAVKGMLPKGPLGYAMAKKLKVYAGAEHPHTAQQPQPLDF